MYVQVYTIYKFVHEETRCDEPHNKNFNLYRHSSKSSTIYSWADTIICNNRNYLKTSSINFSMILHVTVVHVTVVHATVVHATVVHVTVVHVHATVVHATIVHATVVHATVVHVTVVHSCSCHSCYVCACDTESTYDCNIVLTSIRESCTTWYQNVGWLH